MQPIQNWEVQAPSKKPYLQKFSEVLTGLSIVENCTKLRVPLANGEALLLNVVSKGSRDRTLSALLEEVQLGAQSYVQEILDQLKSRFPEDAMETCVALSIFDFKSEKWTKFLNETSGNRCAWSKFAKSFGEVEMETLKKHFGQPRKVLKTKIEVGDKVRKIIS